MAHTIRDEKKLVDRVRRIRGQVDGIEKALVEELLSALPRASSGFLERVEKNLATRNYFELEPEVRTRLRSTIGRFDKRMRPTVLACASWIQREGIR
jgi:Metal-sensitive transcriptional repressor